MDDYFDICYFSFAMYQFLNDLLIITIPGNPLSKTRPRLGYKNGHAQVYDNQVDAKRSVGNYIFFLVQDAKKNVSNFKFPLAGSLQIEFKFYLPIPTSDSYVKSNLKAWNTVAHTKKPDFDNLEKFYLDCGSKLLWADDNQISVCRSSKFYGYDPRVVIKIRKNEVEGMDEETLKILKKLPPERYKSFLENVEKISSKIRIWKNHIDEGDVGEWMKDSFMDFKCLMYNHSDVLKAIDTMKNIE